MIDAALRGSAAVVGVGLAGIGNMAPFTGLELMSQAVMRALADCDLGLADVDGLFTVSGTASMPTVSAAEHLGIRPRYVGGTSMGGSNFVDGALHAMMALHLGLCDVALIAYGSNQRSAGGKLVTLSEPQPWEKDYKPAYPSSSYAMAAARHMHEFGTTREQLAEVAVAARRWAQLNPMAVRREPLTIADVLVSPMFAPPLTVRDSCLLTDGAAAAVMVRADRARSMRHKPVYMLGGAAAYSHRQIAQAKSLTTTVAAESAPRALAMARMGIDDIDVVQLYDAFTINTILFLEDIGFCPKGEGGRFVMDGAIAPGGRLPVNTNGGGLSCVHPGMYGLFLIVESVEQLRGAAGERQIADAEVALVHGNGGVLSTEVTAIFGTETTL